MQKPLNKTGGLSRLWIRPYGSLFDYGSSRVIDPVCYNFYFYGRELRPLAELKATDKVRDNADTIRKFNSLIIIADWFKINDFCKAYLPSSGKKLGLIAASVKSNFLSLPEGTPMPNEVGDYEATRIREDVQDFEAILSDELGKLPIYCCDDEAIGNLSINKLLKGASGGYAEKIREKLTVGCRQEIDEAGKCLVYERSTAAGFHIMRSVELTIRQYLLLVPGFVMPPLNRQSWGEYLKLLKDNGAAREVTDHLHNIKDNYRNPLMHPEDSLEMSDAVSLFAIAQSMNEMLVKDMCTRGFIK